MPPRLSPSPKNGAFYPSNDPNTYRDLLLFEERLKTNAASLNRRKRRYQCVSVLAYIPCVPFSCFMSLCSVSISVTFDHCIPPV